MNKLIIPAACALAALVGCSTATPASRATTVQYTFNYDFGKGARNVTINNKTGDGAISSADSSGSTETQTATPTLDIKPDVDLNYAQGGGISTGCGRAASGAAGIIEKLAATLTDEGLAALKSAIANNTNGTITLKKKDGTTTTATCADGACTFEDGTKVTAEDCANCSTD